MPPSDALAVRVEYLEEWRHEHSREDDRKFEGLDERVRSLEISRAKILGWAAGAAAGGAAITQIAIQVITYLAK